MNITRTLTLYRRHLSRISDAQQEWWLAMTRGYDVRWRSGWIVLDNKPYWKWQAL